MKIKVTKLSEPTLKEIRLKCPGCGASLSRNVPIDLKEARDFCNSCRTDFKWEIIEE